MGYYQISTLNLGKGKGPFSVTGSETNYWRRDKINSEMSIFELPTPNFPNEENTIGSQTKDPL